MNRYELTDHPVVTGIFTNAGGERTDPVTVSVTITSPSGIVTAHPQGALTNPSVGVWSYAVTVDETGVWSYEFDGTGDVILEGDGRFRVGGPLQANGVCEPWVTPGDLSGDCAAIDADILEWACQQASDALYVFSGRIYPGYCSDTIRPTGGNGVNYGPARIPGYGRPFTGNHCCSPLSQIELPATPVVSVDEVKVDGAIVDPSLYRVDDWRWLVRLPDDARSAQAWPCCQRMDLPSSEVGTFESTYTFGRRVTVPGASLASLLACELAKARDPDATCRLPKRVTQVVRQQVTYTILDPLTMFGEMQTGISEIDMWLASVNPHKVKTPAKVWSPDVRPLGRHVGT